MPKTFKRPARISVEERRANKQIALMAELISDQGQLDLLLEGAEPVLRVIMLERLIPHLRFVPDCPICGLRRGSVTRHPCPPAVN